MRFHSHSTFSDEEVQSGSATGFSDGEREESAKAAQRMNNTFDPVTQILDKIDAELVSLTRSQGSSSTATTGTDNTVIRRPNSRQSLESSRLDNGEGLSLSQLGPNFKPSVSLQSEQDTGIGTSSLQDSTLQHRSLEPEVRPLEPGDSFKDDMRGHHRRSATAPEMMFLNGHHMSDDDKQKRENQNASPFEAKHVDDKFKEILQKRKGGALRNADEDSQTIRTEDFVDRFQDTLVYSSADEAEKLRNIEDDLHSDGGSDTDTLQRKLAILTRTPIHNINNTRDGGTRPLPRPLERTKRKLASSLEIRPRKAAGPGTPPVYPKPTPTTSLPRPSARSSLKLTPGHVSDADSVRTEDFEHKFKDMMVNPGGKKEESDLESVSNDPIHTKVKQLLKATAKYKPKSDYKTKQHVRISPQPVQYQDDDKGDDSDDTLCSDKHTTVSSYRSWAPWDPAGTGWSGISDNYSRQWLDFHHRTISKSPSFEDSLSKSSSLSQSSLSSSDREKYHQTTSKLGQVDNNTNTTFLTDKGFSRQTSQVSNATSLPSWSGSELPNTSSNASRCTSTGESMFDDVAVPLQTQNLDKNCFKDYQYSEVTGPTRRRSSLSDALSCGPYVTKKSGEDTMKTNKEKKKHRDIIIQDDEEEAYPFAKYTFNKKTEKSNTDDSTSTLSSMSTKSSSQESIFSVGLMKQYVTLKNGKVPIMNKQSSTSSMISSLTSSFNDPSTTSMSIEEGSQSQDFDPFIQDWRMRNPKMRYQKSAPNLFLNIPPPPMQNPYNYPMYNFPQMPAPEQILNSMGLDEARSILPDRFLKSWIEKTMQTQQEEYMRCMMTASPQMSSAVPSFYDSPYYVDDSDLPPSVSAQQSAATTPQYRSSIENIHGVAKLFPQPKPRMPGKKNLQRSHTFNAGSQNFSKSGTNSFTNNEDEESDLSQVGALPLKKENSFDKLKRILHSSIPVQYKEKNFRRSLFASSHQKSLPICLETLTEEDEEKRRSRTPSFEKITNKSRKASKMKSFLDEEERRYRASSSDNNSDFSSRSSISGHFEPETNSVKKDCHCSELNRKCTCSPHKEKRNEFSLKDEVSVISIPSIVVSEREIDSAESVDAQKKKEVNEMHIETKLESSLPRIVEETCSPTNSEKLQMSRPTSPSPDNQDEHSIFGSRHNSEIAEIMGTRGNTDLPRKGGKKERTLKDFEQMQTEWSFPKTGHFLSISSADFYEKHLSPASSIASPNIMSPVTVIEVHKLDNQNDSLELDEFKASESKSTRHNSSGTVDSNSKSHVGIQREIKFDDKQDSASQQNSQKRKRSKRFKAPKCLKLKRHVNDCDSVSDKDSTSDSENVFDGRKSDVAKNEYKSDEVQADDDSLSPIITVSDVSALLQRLTQSLPQLIKEPMFFLAHDRGTQCNILSAASTNDSINNISTQEEIQVVDADSFNAQKFSVPSDFDKNIDDLLERNHYEDVVDMYSQTDENDFDVEGNDSEILTIDIKPFSEWKKFRTVKEVLIGTYCDSEQNNTIPDIFKSEKTVSLKQMEPKFKIKPCISNNRKTLSSHTSYLKVPVIEKEKTTCEEQMRRNENEKIEFEPLIPQLGQDSFQRNSSTDLFESMHISNDNGSNFANERQKTVENKIFQSDKKVEARRNSIKMKNVAQKKETAENENVNIEKIIESNVEDGDNTNKSFKINQTVDADLDENRNSKNERSTSFFNLNDASSFSSSDISDDMKGGSTNQNSAKSANVVQLENSEQSKERVRKQSPSSLDLKNSYITEQLQNIFKGTDTNIRGDKEELVGLENEVKHESEKDDISQTMLYHTECTVYPEVSLEGFENGRNKHIACTLKGTYTSSIFFELKQPKFDREVFDSEVKDSSMKVSSSADNSEGERCIVESENQSVCIKCGSGMYGKVVQNSIGGDQCSYCKPESAHRKLEKMELNGNDEDKSTYKLDANQHQNNSVVKEDIDESRIEIKTKGRKSHLLRKFRALIGNHIDEVENTPIGLTEGLPNSESCDAKKIFSDDQFNTSQPKSNSFVIRNIVETVSESKSKGRKSNLLRKFKALIGNHVDEVENSPTSSTEDMPNLGPCDSKSEVMPFRSLDFETIGSRKNILQRCLKTGFSKSFDVDGLDGKFEESTDVYSSENRTSHIKTCSFDDRILRDGITESEIHNSDNIDSEFEIQDFYHADDCNKVMYQVGLDYNHEKECFDVYGRVKFYRDNESELYNNNNDSIGDLGNQIPEMDSVFALSEADVMELINREMHGITTFESPFEKILTEMNGNSEEIENVLYNDKDLDSADNKNGHDIHVGNHDAKQDTRVVKGAWRRKVFNMFQQVVDDDVDLIPHIHEASVVEYPGIENTYDNYNGHIDDDDNVDDGHIDDDDYDDGHFNDNNHINDDDDDDKTRETLEKIERLYSLSVYDESRIPENFELEMCGDENLYENGNYLDQEMRHLDLYSTDEYELTETHVCRNCGHSVTMEITGTYEHEGLIKHDYCCKCSPLKFTAEMLERRRVQRMAQDDHMCN